MAGIEDLYQTILGRSADTGGLSFWQGQQAGGMSMDQIAGYFYQSDEFQARLAYQQQYDPAAAALSAPATGQGAATSMSTTGTVSSSFDVSSMAWDDLVNQAKQDYEAQSARKGDDPYMGMTSVGGLPAQIYFAQDPAWLNMSERERDERGPVDRWANVSFNYQDPSKSKDYMTNLSRAEDGSIKVTDYLATGDMGFFMDMVSFVGAATMMYGGITALAEMAGSSIASSGASATGGTGASGAGGVPGTGSAAVSESGFQVTRLTAPWEAAGNNVLGSGLNGIDAVDGLLKLGSVGPGGTFNLGGMTLLPDGALAAAGDLFGATTPWVNPASSTITDVVINSAGSVTDLLAGTDPWGQYVASMGDVLPAGPTTPTPTPPKPPSDPSILDSIPGVIKDVITDIGTGLVVGAVVDKVVGKPDSPSTPSGPNGPGSTTINIPKPDPAASALAPASSQRAGVKFGRTKSKRQLKGKFSGTGLTL